MNSSADLSRTLPKLFIFEQPFINVQKLSPYLNNFNLMSPLKHYSHKKAKLNPKLIQAQLFIKSKTQKKNQETNISKQRHFKLEKLKRGNSEQMYIKEVDFRKKSFKQLKKFSKFNKGFEYKFQIGLVQSEQLIHNFQVPEIKQSNQIKDNPNNQQQEKHQIFANHILKKQAKSRLFIEKYFDKKLPRVTYRAFFGLGNNSQLVKQILLTRKSWIETVEHDTIFHLRWEQSTQKSWYYRIEYDRYKQTVNHLQNHEEISTKAGLLRNMEKYCSKKNINMDQFMPISFILDWSQPQKFQEELKKFVLYYFQKHPTQKKKKADKQYVQLAKVLNQHNTKLVNYSFPKVKIGDMVQLPDIYIDDNKSYVWMMKPSDLNRGRGIRMWSTFQQLTDLLLQFRNDKSHTKTYVIQKYIERPLLINKRKFDIRVWILIDQNAKLYFFEEGYIRTSSEQYRLDNLQDLYVHLTNNAIQKNGQKYGAYQDGNQLSYSQFDLIFQQFAPFRQKILPTIKNITLMVIESSIRLLKSKPINSLSSFEIYGLDFILDYLGKPWLIQVNTNPCLQTSSKVLKCIIPRMLDDAFKIVLDPIYLSSKSQKIYTVQGYQNSKNMWTQLPLQHNRKAKSKLA